MTLQERYSDLTNSFTLFEKTYPAPLKELSVNELNAYADRLIATNVPLGVSVGQEIKQNIFSAGNNLNGTI